MQRPSALSLFLGERVVVNRETGRRTLVEMFDSVVCRQFPFVFPQIDVYVELTDGQGRMTLGLVVSTVDPEEQVTSHQTVAVFPNPLAIARLRFRFRDLSFLKAGQYVFELLANGEVVCHRRLHLTLDEEVS